MVALTSVDNFLGQKSGSTYYRDHLRDISGFSFPVLSFVCLTNSPQWQKVTGAICVKNYFVCELLKSIIPVSIHSVNEKLPNNTSKYISFIIVVSQ